MSSELKTKLNNASVETFVKKVKNKQRQADCFAVIDLMKKITKKEPKMWGSSMIGFDSYHYVYKTGREGDWPMVGVSPRAQNLTVYIMAGFEPFAGLMKKLGKHKTGSSCLYINKLEEIDISVLQQLIKESVEWMREKYPKK